jgi:hypothetical protein
MLTKNVVKETDIIFVTHHGIQSSVIACDPFQIGFGWHFLQKPVSDQNVIVFVIFNEKDSEAPILHITIPASLGAT